LIKIDKGFDLDGDTVTNPAVKLDLTRPASYVVRVGKKKPPFKLIVQLTQS
jgi:hypothetical protein